ncbi:MAG: PilN domain-containing protein [Candidatus Omnitrophota bacterium]|jgi:Tfp pilus assembly PilM family ATPase
MKTRVIVELVEKHLKVSAGHKAIVQSLPNVDPATISAALNAVLRQGGAGKNFDVFVVLSRNKITVRHVEFPSQDIKEIEQMLSLYLIRQIPYHKEEVCWSYQNLGFDGVSNTHLVLAVALKNVFKNIVNSFVPINILPEAVLMSSQGLVHYVNEACRDKAALNAPYFILDVDESYSDLVLVNRHKLGSSAVIPLGAALLEEESERKRFSAELEQALIALGNEVPEARCERIFLTGASVYLSPLVDAAAKDLRLKSQYLSVREYDVYLSAGNKNISLSSVLGFASQVSKEDIKFAVPELQVKKEMKAKVQQLMILGALLVYILVMFFGIGLIRLAQKQSQASFLKEKVADLGKDAQELDSIIESLKAARQYSDAKSSALYPLYDLARICPDNITLTNYNWERDKGLSFRGYAPQIPDILYFVNTLSNSEAFKGAQNRYTRRRKLKDREVVDFDIVVK